MKREHDADTTEQGPVKRGKFVARVFLPVREEWLSACPVASWFPAVAAEYGDGGGGGSDDEDEGSDASGDDESWVASGDDNEHSEKGDGSSDSIGSDSGKDVVVVVDHPMIGGQPDPDDEDPDTIHMVGGIEVTWTTHDAALLPAPLLADRWRTLWTTVGPRPTTALRAAKSWTCTKNDGRVSIEVAWRTTKWLTERVFQNYD